MRLDKFLCDRNMGSRTQVKAMIRRGLVMVNGGTVQSPEQKIDEMRDLVCCQGQTLRPGGYVYYMMNKPAGVVSAVRDHRETTVLDLMKGCSLPREGVFPVGRLDKDTEGLLILTNDGETAHRLLSPKRHVDKTYLVTPARALSEEERKRLEQGVDIGEDKPTLPAKAETLKDGRLLLTIREGKYHQVKRMLLATDNRVIALKRVAFGGICLDEGLKSGEYRELTCQEVEILHEA